MHDQRPDGPVPHFTPDPTRRPGSLCEGDWAESTGWGDVITVMPWQLYLHDGDEPVRRECFPTMVNWLDYLWSFSDGPLTHPHSGWGKKGFSFGDWLQPTGDNRKPHPTISDDCVASIHHFISTDLANRIARIIGEDDEAAALEKRADTIRRVFHAVYGSASGRFAHRDKISLALAFP